MDMLMGKKVFGIRHRGRVHYKVYLRILGLPYEVDDGSSPSESALKWSIRTKLVNGNM